MVNFIKPNSAPYTSEYGYRVDPINGDKKKHHGLDFSGKVDDNILASCDGVVIRTINEGELGGFGNFIVISHIVNGKPYKTIYAHLQSLKVKIGEYVKQGQLIGIKGNTGKSTGKHLHFELHKGNNKLYNSSESLDPKLYIGIGDEKVLNEKQEKLRIEAMELGITDGKNPFTTVNQHYVWSALVPMKKEINELKKVINELRSR